MSNSQWNEDQAYGERVQRGWHKEQEQLQADLALARARVAELEAAGFRALRSLASLYDEDDLTREAKNILRKVLGER